MSRAVQILVVIDEMCPNKYISTVAYTLDQILRAKRCTLNTFAITLCSKFRYEYEVGGNGYIFSVNKL